MASRPIYIYTPMGGDALLEMARSRSAATPRFGRDRVESGHEADIARRPSLTHSVISRPSIAALRKVHSPSMLGVPGRLQSLAGQEHGRTIPLAALRQRQLTHCQRFIRSARRRVRGASAALWIRLQDCSLSAAILRRYASLKSGSSLKPTNRVSNVAKRRSAVLSFSWLPGDGRANFAIRTAMVASAIFWAASLAPSIMIALVYRWATD